jgi:ankyrin repeat protein
MLRQKLDLYVAIKANNLLLVSEALHKFNLQENEFFDDKLSFISLAVLNVCSPIVIEKLIEHGADPNRISFLAYIWPTERQIFNSFEPALITATRHKNIKLCRVLLKRGAKINKSDSFSMTALHWASSLNFTEIVEMLFEYNANVNLMDLNNETPLQKAILNGHKGVVEVYAKNCKLESKCREYFQAAIDSSDIDIFRILLDNIKSGHVDFDLNFIDESVGSLLHYAVILCNVQNNLNKLNLKELLDSPISKVKIIELLIEFGAEINSINKLGETPLHMCR